MRPSQRRALIAVGAVAAVGLVVLYVRVMIDYRSATIVPYSPTPIIPAKLRQALTVEQRSAPRGALDSPADGATVVGATDVRGWALDAAADDAGVDRVRVYVDGAFVTDAEYGVPRQDIANVFGPQFLNSGWVAKLDLAGHALGNHRLEVKAHSSFSDQETAYSTTIVLAPRPSTPRGAIDAPTNAAEVDELTEVRGWALDEAAETGVGVDRVQVYLDGQFMAEAEVGQARPDIAAAYGSRFEASGWRAAIEARDASPGEHRLEARVHSTVGDQETAYAVTVRVSP